MKNSFIVYTSYRGILNDLSDEEMGRLFRALFDYEIDGIEPNFDGELKIAFRFIKNDMEYNMNKYENICERNRRNGSLGGAPKGNQNARKTTQINPKQPKTTQNNPNNNDNDKYIIYNNTGNILEKEKENSAISTRKEKQKEIAHKYGEYSHVLLTDKQYEKLIEDYGQELTDVAIKYLDEYIEMKGTVYKNHNLVLRKWVFDAVEKNQQKNKSDFMSHSYSKKDLNNLFDNIEESIL